MTTHEVAYLMLAFSAGGLADMLLEQIGSARKGAAPAGTRPKGGDPKGLHAKHE